MSNFPLISGQRIVRFPLVWILGLSMLLAPFANSLGAPPWKPGKTYCNCSCRSSNNYKDLSWEKKAHCRLNGRSCTFTDNHGKKHEGKLDSCSDCNSHPLGGFLCLPAKANIQVDDVLGCTVKSPHLLNRRFTVDK